MLRLRVTNSLPCRNIANDDLINYQQNDQSMVKNISNFDTYHLIWDLVKELPLDRDCV